MNEDSIPTCVCSQWGQRERNQNWKIFLALPTEKINQLNPEDEKNDYEQSNLSKAKFDEEE